MATEHTSTGTPATGETTAETIVAGVETAMESAPGLVEVEVDGQRTKWDRKVGMEERAALKREIAREAGNRPAVSRIDLGSAWG